MVESSMKKEGGRDLTMYSTRCRPENSSGALEFLRPPGVNTNLNREQEVEDENPLFAHYTASGQHGYHVPKVS